MRIGELARRAGVSVRSLRYYEEQGLLHSERSPSGQRHYPEEAIDRVVFVQRLYAGGLSSRTITELLPCVETPDDGTVDAAFERMLVERDRLSTHIEELQRTRDSLDELIALNRSYRTEGEVPAGVTAPGRAPRP